MTTFIILCAAMVAAALLWLIVPLLRAKPAAGEPTRTGERRLSAAAVAVAVPALAAIMYAGLSNWNWETVATDTARNAQLNDLLQQLEARLASNPDDVKGWTLLGQASLSQQRFQRAIEAYQRAYELSRGENVDAIIGLGEALAMTDETALSGRAGQLFDEALTRAPNHPKALWYGSMAALQSGNLHKGRDRLQLLLAQSPPAELRSVLERQVQDLDQQIAEAEKSGQGEGAQPAAARSIQVAVALSPAIQQTLREPRTLFVLARDPAGGPPLAVKRMSSSQLPVSVELSERDAMIPTRTIASVPRVEVVARLSKSGNPQAQSGDYFGQVDYEFGKDTGTVNILIDRTVP